MTKIFINYRRGDSIATAGRLHDRLTKAFGAKSIFMDVDHIPVGVDFVRHLEVQLGACDVFLALIGQSWLEARDEQGRRRIELPEDFVAIEIASALRRDIPVIPVLIDGAGMPAAERLPEPIKPMARRNAFEIRNAQFGSDADRLIDKIRGGVKPGVGQRLFWPGMLLAVIALGIGGVVWTKQSMHEPPVTDSRVEIPRTEVAAVPPATEVAAVPPVTVVPAASSATGMKLPLTSTYCDQIKRVVEVTGARFEPILGRTFGANRIAKVPLPDWENCTVFMETKFSERRWYACSLSGFPDLQAAEKGAEDTAKALQSECLGADWAVKRSFDTDGKRRTKLFGGKTNATITLRPSRLATAPSWSLDLNVE